ncbi:MAG: nicotinate phosphoribosyltransferase [Hydrocarboniphaga sp.]|uniref:nicotinate phosphoribosyltransferase n=1 Tax=Hydrocarboniphaga sp. TaxID=2033016 RepID=UPI00261E1621|nr:nicotinate phosphoribosyltransferase [Hydrocarboniphaga sp.]MDB5968330.1 nicotinate phosphoribosyltransferase [Hydrocarboniphaga sp.]
MTTQNLILNTDSYKLSHYLQYPPGTEVINSYIEPRGGELKDVAFFGLQAFLKEYLSKPITLADIDEAETLAKAHVGFFNRAGWECILEKHGGFLPVEIEAVPEGTVLGTRIPLVQIRNTDPELHWLPSYLETALLRAVWYPTTVASLSFACKKELRRYLDETSDDPAAVLPFQLHDFGARGATTDEAAGIGGAGHLLNFMGTDTLAALLVARKHYDEPLAGFSIPASEHSTMTSWGKNGEADAYRNMVERFAGPQKIVAFVVDSYDLWNAVDNIVCDELKTLIENTGGRVVIRPDSGDPIAVLPRLIEHLMSRFGHRVNSKGYRVLPDFIRVIQGDGVNLESLPRILEALKLRGIATENAAFGMGGGLLQKVDRDTMKWAMKASQAIIDGQPRDIFKDPITDPGKRSKTGRWGVVRTPLGYEGVRLEELADRENLLRPVFRNGQLLVDDKFVDIRARTAAEFERLTATDLKGE